VQTDVHEQQRRELLADAYSRAAHEEGGEEEEEEEDMEVVMEQLEELSRVMAQFKELTIKQKERIERSVARCLFHLFSRSLPLARLLALSGRAASGGQPRSRRAPTLSYLSRGGILGEKKFKIFGQQKKNLVVYCSCVTGI